MSKMINFEVDFRTEFGAAHEERKAKESDSLEKQFNECLNSLPKWILKTWEAIEFFSGEEKIQVCKRWLDETNNDFENSHQIIN
jgi:hypothetical protein